MGRKVTMWFTEERTLSTDVEISDAELEEIRAWLNVESADFVTTSDIAEFYRAAREYPENVWDYARDGYVFDAYVRLDRVVVDLENSA